MFYNNKCDNHMMTKNAIKNFDKYISADIIVNLRNKSK